MFDEFVVTNVVSIDSENVTEIDVLVETEVFPLDGEVEETVGGVVSVTIRVIESEALEDTLPDESLTQRLTVLENEPAAPVEDM